MKRLFALVGLTSLCVLTAVFYTGIVFSLCLGGVSLLALIVSLFIKSVRKNKVIPIICVISILCCVYYFVYTTNYVQKIQNEYTSNKVTFTAQVTDSPYSSYGYTYYPLKTKYINNKDESVKILLKAKTSIEAEEFDNITATLMLDKCENNYYISKGFLLLATEYDDFDCKVDKTEYKPPYYYVIKIRSALEKALDTMPKKYSGFAKAVALGNKYELDTSIKENFRVAGLSHVLVVSGLHLSIISSLLFLAFSKLFKNKYVSVILTVIGVFAFTALAGFSVSIVRSCVMTTICLIGMLIPRQADGLNSLGFASIVLLVANPYAVGDVGMLLSFGATLGIILWSQDLSVYLKSKIEKIKFGKRFLNPIISIFSVTICATIAVMPITIIAFGTFSTVVIISNLLVTPVVGIIIASAMLCCITFYMGVLSPLSQMFAFICCAVSKYTFWIVDTLCQIPFATVVVRDSYVYVWLVGTIAMGVAMALFSKGYKHLKLLVSCSAILFVFCFVVSFFINYGVTKLNVHSVGTGVSVDITTQNNMVITSCGGTNSKYSNYQKELEKSTDKINLIIAPKQNQKFGGYAENIINEFDAEQLLIYDNKSSNFDFISLPSNQNNVNKFNENYTVNLWDGIRIELLNQNNNVFEYITANQRTVLILPDKGDCNKLQPKYRQADIIIAVNVISNMQELCCDTLIISNTNTKSQSKLLKYSKISNNVLIMSEQTFSTTINN